MLYFLWEHWFDALVIFGGIIIVWGMLTAILFVWGHAFKKQSAAVEPRQQSDGTAETCKNDSYIKLLNVCRDGTLNTGNCALTNLCWDTDFGCCSDRETPMASADDKCMLTECETTMFGCCPNGVPKIDQMGSNCTDTALCGSSPWGCNSDGSFMTAKLASEMKEKNSPPPSNAGQETQIEKCKKMLGVAKPGSA